MTRRVIERLERTLENARVEGITPEIREQAKIDIHQLWHCYREPVFASHYAREFAALCGGCDDYDLPRWEDDGGRV